MPNLHITDSLQIGYKEMINQSAKGKSR